MDVHRLALVHVCAAVCSHVEDVALFDFPCGLVECLDVVRDSFDALNGTLMTKNFVFDTDAPKIKSNQVSDKVLVENNEFTREGSSHIEIGCEGFEAFVIS